MKKHIFLAGLFMSCLGIGLATLALYFIFDGTRTEVIAVNDQLRAIDKQIEEQRIGLTKDPADPKITKQLAKLHMERVLLPQPWFLQMELAEKGLTSFIFNVLGSAESRRARLRSIVLERAQTTKIDECPAEFQRLFKIYASEEGYGSKSLQAMRDFASSYEDAANFVDTTENLPASANSFEQSAASEASQLPGLSGSAIASEPSELPDLSEPAEPVGPPGGVIQEQ